MEGESCPRVRREIPEILIMREDGDLITPYPFAVLVKNTELADLIRKYLK